MKRWVWVLGAAGLVVGCQSAPEVQEQANLDAGAADVEEVADVVEEPPWPSEEAARHPELDALAWTQAAAERDVATMQAYAVATAQLGRALRDRRWAALPEQRTDRAALRRPPAIILDLDETVLDNSPYQARLLRDGEPFRAATRRAWCKEATAEAVPGALEFVQAAARQRVRVFFVSNRPAEVEEATRRNLKALGFPLDETVDTVLMRGERPEWASSDKQPRRDAVAQKHRVLLLVGDDLGDFVSGHQVKVEERRALVKQHAKEWGTRWIMLPNPMYGSWEGALYEQNYRKTSSERLLLKAAALQFAEPEPKPEEAKPKAGQGQGPPEQPDAAADEANEGDVSKQESPNKGDADNAQGEKP